jgi:hypothetical protein
MRIPKNLIETGKYTSGKEFVYKITQTPFQGYYYILDNLYYVGKEYNKDAANIRYVHLDIYTDSWDVLPDDVEVSFIDAMHTYENCKMDIINSIKHS